MRVLPDNFNARLKSAVVGTADASLVFLGNFEVEGRWAIGEVGLRGVAFEAGRAVVNRMDEFALLLATEADHVVLKQEPDAGYLAYLADLGLELPRIITPGGQDPHRVVTEDALADPATVARLAQLADEGCWLSPHGVSTLEEELAQRSGLQLAAPGAAICKAVNSKVYSRHLADELGLRQAPGWACDTLAELNEAVACARALLAGERKVVVKDAFGVSGKGIAVIETEDRLARLHRMVARRAGGAEQQRVGLVVEEWVAKDADLNYQFTVGRDGAVHLDFVKQALTDGGVHKGHRFPVSLTPAQLDELHEAAERIGKRLADDGYFGVVGVDAMVDPDGGLFPLVEINARNNMSTYQALVQATFAGAGKVALARHYVLRLRTELAFDELRRLLDGVLLDRDTGHGLLVNNFATVNAAGAVRGAATERSFDGRLYGMVVARSAAELTALDDEITARLAAVQGGGGG
ncbi:ATP-grasp domain-containing protein [Pseudonocardia xinjiangensis]|uniref:preATP grasp domain-containing protein n=1 Tax=Pseudonocardia xinjiangensis TaxID=75289 RepID=UPI003D8F8AE2